MFRNLIIKKIVASFMLVVFAFSITPTIFLHNWLANHKDSARKLPVDNQDQVAKKLFNCHCDNIVAESPFTEPVTVMPIPALQVFSSQKDITIVHFCSASHIFYSLRGPPVV